MYLLFFFFFFFQAEDGIRDYKVTGVQTCALPISQLPTVPNSFELGSGELDRHLDAPFPASLLDVEHTTHDARAVRRFLRPEEERDAKIFAHWRRSVLRIDRGVNRLGAAPLATLYSRSN